MLLISQFKKQTEMSDKTYLQIIMDDHLSKIHFSWLTNHLVIIQNFSFQISKYQQSECVQTS